MLKQFSNIIISIFKIEIQYNGNHIVLKKNGLIMLIKYMAIYEKLLLNGRMSDFSFDLKLIKVEYKVLNTNIHDLFIFSVWREIRITYTL